MFSQEEISFPSLLYSTIFGSCPPRRPNAPTEVLSPTSAEQASSCGRGLSQAKPCKDDPYHFTTQHTHCFITELSNNRAHRYIHSNCLTVNSHPRVHPKPICSIPSDPHQVLQAVWLACGLLLLFAWSKLQMTVFVFYNSGQYSVGYSSPVCFLTMILTILFHLPKTAHSQNTEETWERNLRAPYWMVLSSRFLLLKISDLFWWIQSQLIPNHHIAPSIKKTETLFYFISLSWTNSSVWKNYCTTFNMFGKYLIYLGGILAAIVRIL